MQTCDTKFTLQNTILCHQATLFAHVLLGVHQDPQIPFCKARTYSYWVSGIKGGWIWHFQFCFLVDLHKYSHSCRLRQASPAFLTPWFLHQLHWVLFVIHVELHSQCIKKLQRMENTPDPDKAVAILTRLQ